MNWPPRSWAAVDRLNRWVSEKPQFHRRWSIDINLADKTLEVRIREMSRCCVVSISNKLLRISDHDIQDLTALRAIEKMATLAI